MQTLDSAKEDIRRRLKLSTVIGQRVALKRQGRLLMGRCPFHQEKSASFMVDDVDGHYHCFGCAAHGDVFSFLMETGSLSFPEALKEAAALAGVTLPSQPTTVVQETKTAPLYAALSTATTLFREMLAAPLGKAARAYFTNRQVTPAIAERFSLGYAPERGDVLHKALQEKGVSDALLERVGLLGVYEDGKRVFKFRDRLMFPIHDSRGRVVGFGGRILGNAQPKYLNSPETELFKKSHLLYGLYQLERTQLKTRAPLVVEGYMDVIALHQAGFPIGVAPMGTALTHEQITLLWKYHPKPIVCLDGDAAGQKAAHKFAVAILPHLAPGRSVDFLTLPVGEDPDSFLKTHGAEAFQTLINHAHSLTDFLWRGFVNDTPVRTPEDKALFEQNLKTLLTTITDPTVRNHYTQDYQARRYQLFRPASFTNKKSTPAVGQISLRGRVVQQEREQLLTMLPLLAPNILYDHFENYSALELQDALYRTLHDDILTFFSSHPPLAKEGKDAYVSFTQNATAVQELLQQVQRRIGPQTEEAVQALWMDVWRTHCERQAIQQEIEALQQSLKTEVTEASWQHYLALKEQLRKMSSEQL